MGEARRRRLLAAATADQDRISLEAAASRWREIEEIAAEDPDDREVRLAHGFSFDDWGDPSLLCRNGCGLSYDDIASGKIRICRAATKTQPT